LYCTVPTKRLVVSWIGHADLIAMANERSEVDRRRILTALGTRPNPGLQKGPIRTLIEAEQFDRIHLLSNYPPFLADWFAKWLPSKPVIHQVEIAAPTDYVSIFQAADATLASIAELADGPHAELCIHLSPGTPAMTAIWVLLGKSRYPATFYQTYDGRTWKTEIPFDLAFDFVPELLHSPDLSLQHLAARSPQEIAGFNQIIGNSKAIRLAVGRAQKAAIRDVPVLILGETGTGKELFACAIHDASHRGGGPFLAINCAAIPRELLESELFGHKKGAFTGASADHAGAFEQALGGTIFLDEIGECPPGMQSKLLRVLQPPPGTGPCHRVFRRVGETRDRTSDVRVIAATNRNLLQEVEAHRFREDLYYRLAVITLTIPPLRERGSDIPLLVDTFLRQINQDFGPQEPGYKDKSISPAASRLVRQYAWPGNVRQLYNALVQAAAMSAGDCIQQAELEAALGVSAQPQNAPLDQPLGDGFSLESHLQDIQRDYLRRAMQEAGGVKTRAAELLGIANYQTLDAQLKRLGVQWRK
jgi:DNA-binding NtrC family response regulator